MTDESEQTDAILGAYKGEHANLVVTFFFIMAKIIGDRTDEKLVEYIRITKRPTVASEKIQMQREVSGFFERLDLEPKPFAPILNERSGQQADDKDECVVKLGENSLQGINHHSAKAARLRTLATPRLYSTVAECSAGRAQTSCARSASAMSADSFFPRARATRSATSMVGLRSARSSRPT